MTLRPTSAIGVLFVLVHQDRVPLSIALADYHPGTNEWRDVSTLELKLSTYAKLVCYCMFELKTDLFVCLQFVLVSTGDAIIASSPAPLCDGESHEIQVTISGNQTLLLVDGQSGRSENIEVPGYLLSQSSTFIGGLPGEGTCL